MPKPYSMDLRERVVAACEAGTPGDARGWFTHCGYKLAPD